MVVGKYGGCRRRWWLPEKMPEKMMVAGEDGGFMVDPKSNDSGDDISSHIGKNKQFLPV